MRRFIVGTGRCGSTLLSRMLRCNPQVLDISEFYSGLDWKGRFQPTPMSGPEFWDLMHRADSARRGLDIHEIQPVKFGGSPVNPANKIPLTRQQHSLVTTWWNQLQRSMEGR